MKILIDVAYKYVPCKKSARSGSHTKIPRHRRILMRKRRKLFDQLKQAKSEVKQENIKDRLIKIELLLQKSHAESRSRREQLAVKAIKTNSKYFSHTQNSFPVLSRPSDHYWMNTVSIQGVSPWVKSMFVRWSNLKSICHNSKKSRKYNLLDALEVESEVERTKTNPDPKKISDIENSLQEIEKETNEIFFIHTHTSTKHQ